MRFIGFVREVLTWFLAVIVLVVAGLVFAVLGPPAALVDWLMRRKRNA